MKCFHYFKDKSRVKKEQKSAPTLKNKSKFNTSETERVIKSSSSAPSPRSIPELYQEKAKNLRVFKFSELKQATGNFNRLLKIGEGGFGCVYKGTIKPVDGKGDPFVVAIKKLNIDGNQGHKEWVREVTVLGVVDHPNLVKLIGYCAVDAERGIQRLLVYEYMLNKSLDDHLFNPSFPTLSWDQRLQILLGAAKGLAYLHEEIQIQVIYRDFKSSNVLLDEDFSSKLSDFGLAREGPVAGQTHVSTAVVGTYGYAAPDYVETGHLTCESDVWSFGIVLYEILTGRRALEKQKPRSQQNLLDWVKQYPPESRKFSTIMDSRLEHEYSLKAAREVAKLAERCVLKSRKDRPKMSQVVECLKQIVEISAVESSHGKCYEGVEDEQIGEEPVKEIGVVESVKRRMKHLSKMSENLDGVNSRRTFMMMQRAKVT